MENIVFEKYNTLAWKYEPIPFEVKRVYWISNVPNQTIRGTHAHRFCEEIVCVLKGEVDVKLIESNGQITLIKLQQNEKLYIPVEVWKEIIFYEKAILIVYASTEYDASDYVYEDEFFSKNLQDCPINSFQSQL